MAEAYIVEFPFEWFLRGTTATGDRDRATRFETVGAAQEGMTAAKKFMKSSQMKLARIVQAEII